MTSLPRPNHRLRRRPSNLHDQPQLVRLTLSWKQRIAGVELSQNAAERPHVDGLFEFESENDLRRPIESALDISVHHFIFKTTTTEINEFDATLIDLLQQNVLRFEITMDDLLLSDEHQSLQDLNRESPDQPHGDPVETVHLQELIQIDGEKLKR